MHRRRTQKITHISQHNQQDKLSSCPAGDFLTRKAGQDGIMPDLSLFILMGTIENLISELTSGDDERAEACVGKVVAYGPAALPNLAKLLSSPEVDTRWWALRALAELRLPRARDLIIEALNDPETSVRQCAALGLRLQPDPRAVPILITALDHPDALYASLAAHTLVATGEPAVLPLINVLESGTHAARIEAVRALALIGDERSIPALFQALDEDSILMEFWASEGLERMGVGMTFYKPQ